LEQAEILFSFIIPTYNRGPLLVETIASILANQTVSTEIIVVDDGGTDNTSQLIEALHNDRVFYRKTSNNERGAARNYGLMHARGRYVNFFDSDDLLTPCLAELHQFIKHYNYPDVVFGSIECINEHKDVVCVVNQSHPDIKKSILYNNFLACGSVFLKRQVAINNRFSEDRILSGTEDWELWLRVFCQHEFINFPNSVFQQRQHKGRSLNQRGAEHVLKREYAFIQHIQENSGLLGRRFSDSELNLLIADRYTLVALAESESSMKAPALRHLKMAVHKSNNVLKRKRFWAVIKKLIVN